MTGTAVATRDNDKLSLQSVGIDPTSGGGNLSPRSLGEVVTFATVMARSQHAIPKHLRENPGACLAVSMQALRWQMDPFALAAKSYNIKDQIAYEAQAVAAAVNTLAPLKSRPRIEFDGEGDNRTCTVTADFKDGSTHSYTSPPIRQIPTKNSPLWKGDPDQQLGYYSVRSFARRHCPEVILGVYTPDEIDHAVPLRDVTPAPAGIRARLEAAAHHPETGFSEEHVANEIDGPREPAEVDAAIEAEQVVEAEFHPEGEAPAEDAAPDTDQPFDAAEPEDIEDWAVSFNRGLAQLETVTDVSAAWSRAKANGYVAKLRAKSEATAQALAEAVNARVAEINAQ